MAMDNQAALYLGKAVEVARVERGMKRTELEEKTKLSYAYLSEIEKGRKYPSQSAIAKLAEALDMTSFELLSRAEILERSATSQDAFASPGESLGFAVDVSRTMNAPPADDTRMDTSPQQARAPQRLRSPGPPDVSEDLIRRVSAQVHRTVEPRMREWLLREIQLAVREELLRQRETR